MFQTLNSKDLQTLVNSKDLSSHEAYLPNFAMCETSNMKPGLTLLPVSLFWTQEDFSPTLREIVKCLHKRYRAEESWPFGEASKSLR